MSVPAYRDQQKYGPAPQYTDYTGPPQQGYAQPPPGHVAGQGYVISPPPPYGAAPAQPPVVMGMHMPQQGPPPPDYMLQAIMVMLCCFWPTGIMAVMKANSSKTSMTYGDYEGANRNAREAKQMINISLIVGIVCYIILAVIMGVYFGVVIPQIINSSSNYDD